MKNIWSVIFNRAVVDSNSNSISLFDGVDEITVNFSSLEEMQKSTKNIPIHFTVVSLWKDDDISRARRFDCVIELLDPNNKKIAEFTNSPIFDQGKKKLRTITEMNGMTVTEEGEYNLVVKYKENDGKFITAAKLPIDVKFLLKSPIKFEKK